jgi:GntR family transcriptional repressor for pyruvate dehydrogenase complex
VAKPVAIGEPGWSAVPDHLTLKSRIGTLIESHIAAHRLAPGDRLPSERDLAAQLSVSRPSLREALRLLEAQGLLVIRRGQGVFVSTSARDVVRERLLQQRVTAEELFSMRIVLEEPAARWAARRARPDDLTQLQRILDDLDRACAQPIDVGLLTRLDSAFHMRVVETAGNRFLQQTLGVLQEMIASGMETTLTIPGRTEQAQVEHQRILSALQTGDEDGAAAAAKWHIQSAHRAALTRLEI